MSVRDDVMAGKYEPDMVKFPYADPAAKLDRERLALERIKYSTERRRLALVFKEDALAELGLSNLPQAKKDRVWEMAWDRGHSVGLEEVLIELEELATLLA